MPWVISLQHLQLPSGRLPPSALVVSHHRRGGGHNAMSTVSRAVQYMSDLDDGTASVFCLFCDSMWTALERLAMHPETVLSFQQAPIVKAYCPEFVRYFEETTSDVDWSAVVGAIKVNAQHGRDAHFLKRKSLTQQPPPTLETSKKETNNLKRRKQPKGNEVV